MSYGPPTLRNYQHDAVAAVLKEFESHDSTMVVMATGLGKTVTFCEVIRRMQPRRAIVVAHRQELITQACGALERAGMATEIEMADRKADASMFQGSSVIVAMVQSLISGKKDSKRMEKFRPQDFGLLVIDECFPSGTLVDGRPIEGLKVGDCATTALPGETLPEWNVGLQRISAIFKRKPYRMVSVHFSDGSRIACTPEHPFWSDSRKDWVLAVLLDSDDVVLRLTTHELSMQELRNINGAYDQVSQGSDSGRSGTVLQSRMCEGVVQETILRDNGGDKSEVCVTADEGEKPNESSRDQRKGVSDSQNNGPQTFSERGKRTATNGPAENAWRSAGVDFGICDSNKDEEGLRVSNVLQGGPCQPDINDRRGSGRKLPSHAYTKEPGPKEGSFFEKLRVDRIEVHEQTSDGTFGGVCPDGYVYNIEVEHAHHYFANGILVHNCHHSVASSYKKVIDHFRQNTALKVLGVTATPDRFDAKALGQICESVAFKYDIAEAIEDGWLVPIEQQFVRIKSLDISHVRTTAGDLNGADLAKVWEDEKNLQGMVGASISVIGNRKAIAFTSSVRHAEMCCDIFNRHRAGMAAWISGDTPEDDRRKILTQFKASEVQVLANVGIATEGFDCPDVEVVIMGRATKSRSLYTQMVGRGTRAASGVIDGLNSAFERREAIAESRKPSMLVLDFVGNSGKHKLVTTADILGGKYDEETMAEAVKEAEESGQPVRMDKALGDAKQKIIERIEQAKLEEARRKAKLVARVEFVSRHISPFDAFQITPKQDSKWDKGRPLSEKQRGVLLKLGVNPDETNYAACKQVLYEYFRRKEEGLCTLAQAKVLLRAGYDPKKLKFEEASLLINDLKKNNWQRTDQLISA